MTGLEDGEPAVKIARELIVSETSGDDPDILYPEEFDRYAGVFVTIKKHPSGNLRGCIGYPEPVLPLIDALCRSARHACHDPRFPSLKKNEVNDVIVEVTILSAPKEMTSDKEQLVKDIVIGRDGLILDSMGRRGVLLPQVPIEWEWDVLEYLENLSIKAGLDKNAWRSFESTIYSFTGEIFSEETPNGKVKKV